MLRHAKANKFSMHVMIDQRKVRAGQPGRTVDQAGAGGSPLMRPPPTPQNLRKARPAFNFSNKS
jgi:hypothetical protein